MSTPTKHLKVVTDQPLDLIGDLRNHLQSENIGVRDIALNGDRGAAFLVGIDQPSARGFLVVTWDSQEALAALIPNLKRDALRWEPFAKQDPRWEAAKAGLAATAVE